MKLDLVGRMCCWCVFRTVYTLNSVVEISFRCRKLASKNELETKQMFSVPGKNLISCALVCYSYGMCGHFSYNKQNTRCKGYRDGENACDNGAGEPTVSTERLNPMSKHICKKRCKDAEGEGTGGRKTRVRAYKTTSKGKCQHVDVAPDNKAARLRGKCLCKDRCGRSKYTLIIYTGVMETHGSKADLVLTVTGTCGELRRQLINGEDVDLTRGGKSELKFEEKPVCKVLRVSFAFADCCHEDDWFLRDAILVTTLIDRTQSCHNVLKFYVRSFIGARSGDRRTTGLTCVFHTKRSSLSWKSCTSSQRCLES